MNAQGQAAFRIHKQARARVALSGGKEDEAVKREVKEVQTEEAEAEEMAEAEAGKGEEGE